MAIQIIDDGSTLNVVVDGTISSYPKDDLTVEVSSEAASQVILKINGKVVQAFDYTKVSSPVSTSGENLRSLIDIMLQTGTGTGATEATLMLVKDNLNTALIKLQSIADNTDTLEINTDELEARIGEVNATPTANTLQDRLKGIKTVLDSVDLKDFATQTTLISVLTESQAINSELDTHTVKLTSLDLKDYATQTTLALIKAKTDNIDVLISTLATQATLTEVKTELQSVNSELDTHTTKLTSLDAKDFSTSAKQDLIEFEVENALRVDEASATVTYVGYAVAGTTTASASWSVKKITLSGTETISTWADGNKTRDNVWDNRAALSYS